MTSLDGRYILAAQYRWTADTFSPPSIHLATRRRRSANTCLVGMFDVDDDEAAAWARDLIDQGQHAQLVTQSAKEIAT
ncbi:hypothetical protein PG993_013504 [Apiospora rasikravindrae]|uniref:Uncharacterized protein n=1 Tax=Apiospora rasikravindrae TaxID=990691 RepID=A0ABR1RXT5_9PEZI